ncbi:MAG: hypothetical protein M1827_005272 [Pycnora praestabilis]|nr:MAG: hypothetical protein M1827_005272 [Pycnora praestabilis]
MEIAQQQQLPDYTQWSHSNLIERVTELEKQLKAQTLQYESTCPEPTALLPPHPKKPPHTSRTFDPTKYSTRLIALKFAYLGQRYNGYEHHLNNTTPLPTIEEKLWEALNKARLIFPTGGTAGAGSVRTEGEVDWEGCEYSKCGRTDKGVSAFGQVVGIRVRSNRPLVQQRREVDASSVEGNSEDLNPAQDNDDGDLDDAIELASSPLNSHSPNRELVSQLSLSDPSFDATLSFDPIRDELPYAQILNRLLPEDIRILAWCPSPPLGFNARFSCGERHYKYFFTQPAFAPIPGEAGLAELSGGRKEREGWLDISAMRKAAKFFEGTHDFRNFCKLDASKQITNFERRILHAEIEELDPSRGPVGYVGKPEYGPLNKIPVSSLHEPDFSHTPPPIASTTAPKIYTITIHGSAFLWHQIRHIASILFLIGQGLEPPAVVPSLLDTTLHPTKPTYDMASDAPLVLWDCIYPREGSGSREDAMEWVYVGDERGAETGKTPGSAAGDGKFGMRGVVDDVWKVWRRRKIDEMLAGTLLDVVAAQGQSSPIGGGESETQINGEQSSSSKKAKSKSQKVFEGGNAPALKGRYIPVLQRKRLESVEVVNARYAARKGFENTEELKEKGWRRVSIDKEGGD